MEIDAWARKYFVLNKEGMDWCKNLLNKLKMEREAAVRYFVKVSDNGNTFVTNSSTQKISKCSYGNNWHSFYHFPSTMV